MTCKNVFFSETNICESKAITSSFKIDNTAYFVYIDVFIKFVAKYLAIRNFYINLPMSIIQ